MIIPSVEKIQVMNFKGYRICGSGNTNIIGIRSRNKDYKNV